MRATSTSQHVKDLSSIEYKNGYVNWVLELTPGHLICPATYVLLLAQMPAEQP